MSWGCANFAVVNTVVKAKTKFWKNGQYFGKKMDAGGLELNLAKIKILES